jgi:putative ABC transport system substrate-binding protein
VTRREFITLLGGAAASWPLTTRAQQPERVRRIGVLAGGLKTDMEFQARIEVFRQQLQQLGWTEGSNVRIDIRWGAGEVAAVRKLASELVALAPDVILAAGGNPAIAALQQAATLSIPIVFVGVTDPVGAGFVANLARPAGNITGFTPFEYGISAKWLELLKQIDPRVKRAGVMRDPANPTGIGLLAAMQGAASG